MDYRIYAGQQTPAASDVEAILQWAPEKRLNTLDLYDILGEVPPAFPPELYATEADDPEQVATRVREPNEFRLEEQASLRSARRHEIAKLVRRAVEGVGAIVLRRADLRKHGVRGICLFDEVVPAIVFGRESPVAQAFTIAHELGHVVLRNGSISGFLGQGTNAEYGAIQERWCKKFAAAFLIPAEALGSV